MLVKYYLLIMTVVVMYVYQSYKNFASLQKKSIEINII